jgi:hypothetical protein
LKTASAVERDAKKAVVSKEVPTKPVVDTETPIGEPQRERVQEGPPTEEVDERAGQSVDPVEGTGEAMPRTLPLSVEATAEGMVELMGDAPEYQQVNLAEQATAANEIIDQDYEAAKQMAMGQIRTPEDVMPEAVMVAVVNKAVQDGDINTVRDIATMSKLTQEATTMGQRIRTLGELGENSPIKAMSQLISAREKAYEKRHKTTPAKAKTADTKKVKDSIKKASRKGNSELNSFIASLQC